MKLVRILLRSIRDSFKGVIRNLSLSVASISCITITLFVVAISMVLSVNVNNMMQNIKDDVTIVAWLDQDISEEGRDYVGEEIKKIDNVVLTDGGVVLDKKEDIREEWMESSDTYRDIMKNWNTREDNPLRDAYHVKVIDIDKLDETADAIGKIEGVYLVEDMEEMVTRLVNVFDIITKITYAVVLALILVTAFLIANTIKITIFSRKREIDIMRLVGASNTNIKIPFIFEGLFLGILGSILPILVTIYGYSALYGQLEDGRLFGSFITLVKPEPFIYLASLILLLIGVVVGMIGSWRAVRKHLKI